MEEYRLRANRNYRAKKTQIGIVVDPDVKEEIQARAKAAGLSMTEYIVKKCTSVRPDVRPEAKNAENTANIT